MDHLRSALLEQLWLSWYVGRMMYRVVGMGRA